jgi:hypothetical protein
MQDTMDTDYNASLFVEQYQETYLPTSRQYSQIDYAHRHKAMDTYQLSCCSVVQHQEIAINFETTYSEWLLAHA